MEKHAKAQDQVAMPSSQIKQREENLPKRESEMNDVTDRGQEARFGFTNIGGTGSVSIELCVSLLPFFYKYLLEHTFFSPFLLLCTLFHSVHIFVKKFCRNN